MHASRSCVDGVASACGIGTRGLSSEASVQLSRCLGLRLMTCSAQQCAHAQYSRMCPMHHAAAHAARRLIWSCACRGAASHSCLSQPVAGLALDQAAMRRIECPVAQCIHGTMSLACRAGCTLCKGSSIKLCSFPVNLPAGVTAPGQLLLTAHSMKRLHQVCHQTPKSAQDTSAQLQWFARLPRACNHYSMCSELPPVQIEWMTQARASCTAYRSRTAADQADRV